MWGVSLSSPEARPLRAAIFGCAGEALSEEERRFFREAAPFGFILFRRNCRDPAQVRRLTEDLRACAGRQDAAILIDQEGGRVARLLPPHWHALPRAAAIGALYAADRDRGREAAWLAGRIAAADLAAVGINVDCAPVLDVWQKDAHRDAIGDRAYGSDPEAVATLGRAFSEGLLAGGVLPVVKHIPGHGRGKADSHFALPVVDAPAGALAIDLAPFRALADAPFAMTAHILYPAWDAAAPATTSRRIVADVIRGEVGFRGLLMTDDLSMQALQGGLAERAAASIAAGCDLVLHCNGNMAEMREVAATCPPLSDPAAGRWERARAMLRRPEPFDVAAGAARLAALLRGPDV